MLHTKFCLLVIEKNILRFLPYVGVAVIKQQERLRIVQCVVSVSIKTITNACLSI